MPKMRSSFALSSLEFAGRFAGAGYSAEGIAWISTPPPSRLAISVANPCHVVAPAQLRCTTSQAPGRPAPRRSRATMAPVASAIARDHVGVREVELRAVTARDLAQRSERTLELPADLAVLAGDENSQGKTSASRSRTPVRSLSDRVGEPASGQSMPMSSSFQAIVRSNC